MQSPHAPMLGTRVPHYDIIRPLGSGGMGVVYEGEDAWLAGALPSNSCCLRWDGI